MDDKIRTVKEIHKSLPEELKDIPESVLQMFLETAMKDAQKLFDTGKANGDFKQVTYTIYRAYVLGILFEKSNIQKKNKVELIRRDNNIIYMDFNSTPPTKR